MSAEVDWRLKLIVAINCIGTCVHKIHSYISRIIKSGLNGKVVKRKVSFMGVIPCRKFHHKILSP